MDQDKIRLSVEKFVLSLKRREITGSYQAATATADLLRQIIASTRWDTAQTLMKKIKEVGVKLTSAAPQLLVIGNVVRRVLYIIREEYLVELKERDAIEAAGGVVPDPTSPTGEEEGDGEDFSEIASETRSRRGGADAKDLPTSPSYNELLSEAGPALHSLLETSKSVEDFSVLLNIKTPIIEQVNELINELTNTTNSIAEQAIEHIHANEVILTYGRSRAVEEFLKKAATKRQFEVIVAESVPSYEGQELAMSLAKAGIETTLITDAAVFAMMARVNKVIVGCYSVMANGGVIALAGGHTMALAAKQYSVPFVVCAGLMKLTPMFPYDQDTFNELLSPQPILKFEEAEQFDDVKVLNPVYDYIPPGLVSLFISNFVGHNPSYIYRLLAEYYHPEDYTLTV